LQPARSCSRICLPSYKTPFAIIGIFYYNDRNVSGSCSVYYKSGAVEVAVIKNVHLVGSAKTL
jgi:hypothetical protein